LAATEVKKVNNSVSLETLLASIQLAFFEILWALLMGQTTKAFTKTELDFRNSRQAGHLP
jgi:hypothetical protein